jgi:hypothetical protein
LSGEVGLVVALAFASGLAAIPGAVLAAHSSARLLERPPVFRLLAVVRTPLVDSARESLATIGGARVLRERRVEDLLGEPSIRPGGERLRVLEVVVDGVPPSHDPTDVLAAMRAAPGVSELIESDDRQTWVAERRRAAAQLGGGVVLMALGGLSFLVGVSRAARVAAGACRDELVARVLLGADIRQLWLPFGSVFAAAALAGVLLSVLATDLVAWIAPQLLAQAGADASGWLASPASRVSLLAALVVLLLVASGGAAFTARRAVTSLAQGATLLLCVVCTGLVLGAGSGDARAATDGDWQVLRGLARELSVNRRALVLIDRELAADDVDALRALGRDDVVARRLRRVLRRDGVLEAERLRRECALLRSRREELRELHRFNFAPGPPIEPRVIPARGDVLARFEDAHATRRLHTYHRGVALRTRPTEVVRATAAGRVAYAGGLAGFGPVVVLNHGRRTFSVYGKVSELLVVRGMQVEPGEPVARPGSDGTFFFSVRERGRAVDPLVWVRSTGRDRPPGPRTASRVDVRAP